MTTRLIIVSILMFLVGCTSYPRYRNGGAETPPVVTPTDKKYTTNENLRLGSIIQAYLGKPYRGKSKYAAGVDCSLFAREVFDKFNGLELPRTVKDQYKAGKKVNRKHLVYGDLVFFNTERNKVSHVGIYVGYNEFAHASTSKGVIVSGLNEKYWAKRFVGARRVLD